ncbi:zinc finger and SCAN domain-containing protein 32-like isoform X1 [Mauremys reevesii]|uniref:zinc finger and SCAN domain-containing protein 32-like isoform X1 n=1 Tax=Mauremys reevesii TaxID=260615 RepID=UPI00193F88C4|nr:zinc finger and SCAN domain-containing protein 32-like isoform X1 [Mauremys reevesii]
MWDSQLRDTVSGSKRPRAFSQRLMDWATWWLRPAAQTIEEVMDQVVLEQFLVGLPDPVHVWVRTHQPGHVSDAVHLTEEYVEAEGPWQVDKKEQIHMVPAGGALRTQKRESLSSQFLYPVSQRPGSLKEKL